MANKEFYKYARAYDIAFSGRDYGRECDFVEWCYDTYAKGAPRSMVELGCGPAAHARVLAKRGWECTALDLSEEMLKYGAVKAREEGVELEFYCGDMIEYRLRKKVQLAGMFTESVTHILTNDDMVKHLRSTADNLLPGGIYIIETAHPFYFFPDGEENRWSEEENGMKVEILFGTPEDEYDAVTQQWKITTELTINEEGKAVEVMASKSLHRWYLVQELRALAELSGAFEQIHFYGNMNVPPDPLDNSSKSDSMIVVLIKKGV